MRNEAELDRRYSCRLCDFWIRWIAHVKDVAAGTAPGSGELLFMKRVKRGTARQTDMVEYTHVHIQSCSQAWVVSVNAALASCNFEATCGWLCANPRFTFAMCRVANRSWAEAPSRREITSLVPVRSLVAPKQKFKRDRSSRRMSQMPPRRPQEPTAMRRYWRGGCFDEMCRGKRARSY